MNLNAKEEKQLMTWIEGLYSRSHRQARGQLNDADGYCCIGLGCSLTIPHKKLKLNNHGFILGAHAKEQPDSPEWLKQIDADFYGKTGRSLTELNDDGIADFPGQPGFGETLNFEEIADLLLLIYILGADFEEEDQKYVKTLKKTGNISVLAS